MNCYLPSTTPANDTKILTRFANTSVHLSTLYAYPIFTVYTGYGFHPRCISGCINYFTADYGVTAPSNLVSIWNDQSGNNNNATQGSSGLQPTLSLKCCSIMGSTRVTFCFVCYCNTKALGMNS